MAIARHARVSSEQRDQKPRRIVAQRLGKESTLFAPDRIAAAVKALDKGTLNDLAYGLQSCWLQLARSWRLAVTAKRLIR